jgi:hypothetical protein
LPCKLYPPFDKADLFGLEGVIVEVSGVSVCHYQHDDSNPAFSFGGGFGNPRWRRFTIGRITPNDARPRHSQTVAAIFVAMIGPVPSGQKCAIAKGGNVYGKAKFFVQFIEEGARGAPTLVSARV